MAITLNDIMKTAFQNYFGKPSAGGKGYSDTVMAEEKGTALFNALAGAYREMTGINGEVKASDLFKWYQNTYDKGKSMKGNHRSVNSDTDKDEYSFDWVFQKDSLKYLNGEENDPPADYIIHMAIAFKLKPAELDKLLQDYGYLPLHVRNLHHLAIYAVLSKCDRSDNSYDQFNTVKEWYFDALEMCEAEMAEKATAKPASNEKNTALEAIGLTKVLRDELRETLQQHGSMEKEQFLTFVKDHYTLFRQRHSAILNEHMKLASVLSELNIRRRNSYEKFWTEAICWDIDKIKECKPNVIGGVDDRCDHCVNNLKDLKTYNFECFVEHFCKAMKQKDFRDHLKTHIHKSKTHHPSRESMILLWLFAEIYRNHEPMSYPPKYLEYIKECLGVNKCVGIEKCPGVEECLGIKDCHGVEDCPPGKKFEQINACFTDRFDVARYLFGRAAAPNKYTWVGADVQRAINDKLKEYDWGMLNQKLPFDRMVMCFLQFNIEKVDENRIAVTLAVQSEKSDSETITRRYIERESIGYDPAQDERNVEIRNPKVPAPLWLLVEFALYSKFALEFKIGKPGEKPKENYDDRLRNKYLGPKDREKIYPFLCNLYEQTI